MSTTVIAMQNRRPIILGLGGNVPGIWGPPRQTIDAALNMLSANGVNILRRSHFYHSRPLGYGAQPWFTNIAVSVDTCIPPAALLRLLKRLELKAGRRRSRRWGPRPLDIDILDYRGKIMNHSTISQQSNTLILPHPGMLVRNFVLYPVDEIAPAWRHPCFGVSAQSLLRRNPRLVRGIHRICDDCELQVHCPKGVR